MIFLCVRKNAIAERDLSTKRTFGDLKVMFCGTSRKGIHLNFRSELYGNSLLLLCNWLIWVSIYTDREHAMTTRVAQVCLIISVSRGASEAAGSSAVAATNHSAWLAVSGSCQHAYRYRLLGRCQPSLVYVLITQPHLLLVSRRKLKFQGESL